VVPTLATVIGAGLWHYLVPERFKAWRGSLLATAIVALLISMLLTSLVHPTYQSVFETLPQNEP
jgi:dolichol kinase